MSHAAAVEPDGLDARVAELADRYRPLAVQILSLIHISEPTRLLSNSYAVFCLKKKKKQKSRHNHMTYKQTHKIPHTISSIRQYDTSTK